MALDERCYVEQQYDYYNYDITFSAYAARWENIFVPRIRIDLYHCVKALSIFSCFYTLGNTVNFMCFICAFSKTN